MITICAPAFIKSKCALVISAGFDLINSPLQSEVVNLFPLLSNAVERPPSNLIAWGG